MDDVVNDAPVAVHVPAPGAPAADATEETPLETVITIPAEVAQTLSPLQTEGGDSRGHPPKKDLTSDEISARRNAARQQSADSIRPGCEQWVVSSWKPIEKKPQLKNLLSVISQRFPSVKAKSWEAQKIADYLHEHNVPVTCLLLYKQMLLVLLIHHFTQELPTATPVKGKGRDTTAAAKPSSAGKGSPQTPSNNSPSSGDASDDDHDDNFDNSNIYSTDDGSDETLRPDGTRTCSL
jgi:hypothetical protein